MENELKVTIEFEGIKFVATKDQILIYSEDAKSEKKCCLETSFAELDEVTDIIGASVLAGDDDDED